MLTKDIETTYGLTANYWVVSRVDIRLRDNRILVTLDGYTEGTCWQECKPFVQQMLTLDGIGDPAGITGIEQAILQLPDWADAVQS